MNYNKKHIEIYNPIERERLEKVIDGICEILPPESEKTVLDFGAGTGNLSRIFFTRGYNIVAGDICDYSLGILKKDLPSPKVKTVLFNTAKLPFADDSFDICATYSVLHHIPDYLYAVKEMVRVTKSGGLIYIDHEVNENRWNPSATLKKYYYLTRQTVFHHVSRLFFTGELFSLDFIKAVFIKLFLNKRYQREGDIHIFKDDHIEWQKIEALIGELNCRIVKKENYLMYRPKMRQTLFAKYATECNDMSYVLIQK